MSVGGLADRTDAEVDRLDGGADGQVGRLDRLTDCNVDWPDSGAKERIPIWVLLTYLTFPICRCRYIQLLPSCVRDV